MNTRLAVVALPVVSLLTACSSKTKPSEALEYLPSDTQVILAINGDGLRDQFAPLVLEQLEADAKYRAFKRTCGIDPVRALERVTFAITDLDGDEPSGVLVLQGGDVAGFLACATKAEPSITKDGDVLIAKDASGTFAMKLVNERTLVGVFGPDASADEVREVARGGSRLASDAKFGELLASIDTSRAVWFAARGDALLPVPLRQRPRSIGGSIDLDSRVGVRLVARFDDADTARDAERFGKDLVEGITRHVAEAELSRDGAALALDVTFSREDTKRLLRDLGGEW